MLLVGLVGLVGCAGGQSGSTPTGTTAAAPTIGAAPTSTAAPRPECTAVETAARNVADQVAAVVREQGDREQLALAADRLRAALVTARAGIKPEARADVDAAINTAQQLQVAARATPFNLPAVRAAAVQLLDDIGRVFAVCVPASPAPSP
jgi:hypothetical protein